MHWWQSAFSSSSSGEPLPSSSTGKLHSDDSMVMAKGGRYTLKGAFMFARGRRRSAATANRHGGGGEQDSDSCMHSSCDISPARTSTSGGGGGAVPSPLPLPLPELQSLLGRQEANSGANSCSVPLPCPGDRDVKREGKTESHHSIQCDAHGDGAVSLQRFLSQAAKKNTGNLEKHKNRKSMGDSNHNKRRYRDLRVPSPISAPTSPYSSPAILSPLTCGGDHLSPKFVPPPSIFQVWSAPEIPHSIDHTALGLAMGFSHQFSLEKTAFSVDSSPHQSPKLSPTPSIKSPSRPTSPFQHLLPNSNSNNSNSQSNVHPLPRPPSSGTLSQLSPSPSPSPALPVAPGNSELVPIKGQWQKGKLIGRGTFGSVYVGSNRETGALCAMKEVEILPDDSKSAECMRQLHQEIKVLSNLKHPNIVQYFGSEIVGDKFYIYLEYVHPGSINKFIRDHCGAITESVVRNFTRHILSGLAYLHGTKTIHRDIKGANLLVDAYGVVKLADFGMSKHLSGQVGHLSLKGSPYWMAPELLQSGIQDSNSEYAYAIDIWSLGCTIIEMMNGKPPWSEYEGPAAMFKVLMETPPIPDSLSPEGKDFLQCCFRRNPAERPTASMLLEHRFVKNLHYQSNTSRSLNGVKLTENLRLKRERVKANKKELKEVQGCKS